MLVPTIAESECSTHADLQRGPLQPTGCDSRRGAICSSAVTAPCCSCRLAVKPAQPHIPAMRLAVPRQAPSGHPVCEGCLAVQFAEGIVEQAASQATGCKYLFRTLLAACGAASDGGHCSDTLVSSQ